MCPLSSVSERAAEIESSAPASGAAPGLKEQRAEQIAVLEEMLRDAQAAQEQSVKDAARKAEDAMSASRAAALQVRQVQARAEVASAAKEARSAWFCVRETAESELELVRANRGMLGLLLAGLEHTLVQLSRH